MSLDQTFSEHPVEHALASNLRCLRKRLGLSQEDLASRVGLNRGNIASYENGTAEPKLCNLLRFSQLFGVSIHDLTRRDMSCDQTYRESFSNFVRLNSEEVAALEDFEKQSSELQGVFDGIIRCYDYMQRKSGPFEGDVRTLDAQFNQLRHLTEELQASHRALLSFVKCRLKD